jgi:gliding motility-associated-like protein
MSGIIQNGLIINQEIILLYYYITIKLYLMSRMILATFTFLSIALSSPVISQPFFIVDNFGDSIRLEAMTDALEIESILWSPPDYLNRTDSLVVFAAPPEEIVYSALLTTVAGCTVSDDITLFVRREEKIFIPNAFTPNGDGANDSFRVFFGDGITAIGSIKIFNRWGDLVFDQSGDVEWDGKFRGKAAQMGVYVYLVRVELSDGTERLFSGDVTLLR